MGQCRYTVIWSPNQLVTPASSSSNETGAFRGGLISFKIRCGDGRFDLFVKHKESGERVSGIIYRLHSICQSQNKLSAGSMGAIKKHSFNFRSRMILCKDSLAPFRFIGCQHEANAGSLTMHAQFVNCKLYHLTHHAVS